MINYLKTISLTDAEISIDSSGIGNIFLNLVNTEPQSIIKLESSPEGCELERYFESIEGIFRNMKAFIYTNWNRKVGGFSNELGFPIENFSVLLNCV
jgi:hypothetical protein